MAFNKKTWVNRVVQYPLRRLLTIIRPDDGTGTEIVDIQREDGEVTIEGDAFTASNMNDLESRIEAAFNDAGGGNFVGVKYHASLVDFPGVPCWEDLTSDEKAKFDISTGATINFLDDETIPDDILGDTDISGIADGTLTGAIDEHDTKIATNAANINDLMKLPAVGAEKIVGYLADGVTPIYRKHMSATISNYTESGSLRQFGYITTATNVDYVLNVFGYWNSNDSNGNAIYRDVIPCGDIGNSMDYLNNFSSFINVSTHTFNFMFGVKYNDRNVSSVTYDFYFDYVKI